jgi:hypothetical protein
MKPRRTSFKPYPPVTAVAAPRLAVAAPRLAMAANNKPVPAITMNLSELRL